MIEVRNLTKRYDGRAAVRDLSFTVLPGQVTGFLGPNGSGKTTSMRCLLGLAVPNAGSATINGKRYQELRHPLRQVGALLDAKAVHPGRSAYHHLLCLAQSNGIGRRRVDELIGMVGLTKAAGRRIGGFSLGMGQRLGIAAALLGDPGVLLFDEPINGLDPDGIHWIRKLMRELAAEGRTVLVSSHVMAEMEDTADHLVVIGKGQLIAETSLSSFLAGSAHNTVLVRSPQAAQLHRILVRAGAAVTAPAEHTLSVTGMTTTQVGDLAGDAGLRLHELSAQRPSLETAYLELTRNSVEFQGTGSGK